MILQESRIKEKKKARATVHCLKGSCLISTCQGKKKKKRFHIVHIWRLYLHMLIMMFLCKYQRDF